MKDAGKFSLDNFKKWMNEHQENSPCIEKRKSNELIGTYVESKINTKKLIQKITSDNDNLEKIAKDFFENGGHVIDIEDHHFIIEVDSGSFSIHRLHVKRF